MVVALIRVAKSVTPIVALGLLIAISACIKRALPPIDNSAAALVVLSPARIGSSNGLSLHGREYDEGGEAGQGRQERTDRDA